MRRTIKSSREIDGLFQGGARAKHTYIVALSGPTPEGRGRDGRVAFIAGKKLGNAVARNRAKRVMKASVERNGGPWPGWDIALIARPRTGQASPAQLDESLQAILRNAGVLP